MHISGRLRKKYRLTNDLFTHDGKLLFSDFPAIHRLLQQLNNEAPPGEQIYPGEMRASALLQEVYEHMLRAYEKLIQKNVFSDARMFLEKKLGAPSLYSFAEDFTKTFPPSDVYTDKKTARQYLSETTLGRQHLELAIEKAMILSFANENPANKKLEKIFGKRFLGDTDRFELLVKELEVYFNTLPPFGPENKDIFSLFRVPFTTFPDDFYAQLDYIITHWKHMLPGEMAFKILQGKDLMKEDQLMGARPGGGPPPTVVPGYKKKGQGAEMRLGKSGYDAVKASSEDYDEGERFTPDTHWMPRVVLIAKNAYVWLDQLSAKYQREIRRLDQIPDEELDQLARWHFNGLWLIGIWERSTASRKIKHLMGNRDAISSAYALFDYEVAHALGGEQAYHNLNERALQRGLRLASDMVPNHTGIYSKWMIEHPDYFIQTATPPFPGYSFTGENLSDHPHIEIRIEDGYYNKSDAAVVFQRIDRQTNHTRYIYHGNDGTMMPWNDTAQLDMVRAEVREAVMQKIFDVAGKFSIIRFDAAMTLAKKHFARLWYPRPGTGGDIPSRAEHAMTKEAFDAMFPVEFWREVVDRINRDLPETLLLAEAFWFMEGYFVRTLGMHRVYNSAFMHMLKNEENEKYRDLISNTLEFEPEILKRYVNFMSNPDEETAIQQFGTGDKYFGICVLMNTLPGLPMFAHGQIEGYTEKYGMEYQRAYYHEKPNQWLTERHEREIFPLAKKRHLFSEVKHFHLYDYIDNEGRINENVIAYTNRYGDEKALILFNNKYETAMGGIQKAAPRLSGDGNNKKLTTTTLADALGMKNADGLYYHAYEHISGQEYLFSGKDMHQGIFHWALQGFEYRAFLSFRELQDSDGSLGSLYNTLQGRGMKSLEESLALQKLGHLHRAFEQIFDHNAIHELIENNIRAGAHQTQTNSRDELCNNFREFAGMACMTLGMPDVSTRLGEIFSDNLDSIPDAMHFLNSSSDWDRTMFAGTAYQSPEDMMILSSTSSYRENTFLLIAYFVLHAIKEIGLTNEETDLEENLLLDRPLEAVLKQTGHSETDITKDKELIKILLKYKTDIFDFTGTTVSGKFNAGKPPVTDPLLAKKQAILEDLLDDSLVRKYLGVNQHEGTWYYSKEQFENLTRWLFSIAYLSFFRKKTTPVSQRALPGAIKRAIRSLLKITELSDHAGYKLHKLSESLGIRVNNS